MVGNLETDAGAAGELWIHPDAALMRVQDALHSGEANAISPLSAFPPREGLEDTLLILSGIAGSVQRIPSPI